MLEKAPSKSLLLLTQILLIATMLLSYASGVYAQDDVDEFSAKYSEFVNRFANLIVFLIDEVSAALLKIAKAIYSLMALAGLLMWATGFHYRTGRNLIISSVILSIFVECIYPVI